MALIEGKADDYSTFVRASGAARVNAQRKIEWMAANFRRDDFDPLTGAPRGVLVEPQATRLNLYPTDAANWSKNADTTIEPNSILAPDGTMTGAKIIAGPRTSNPEVGTGMVHRSVSMAAGPNLRSIFVKLGTYGFARLSKEANSNASVSVRLNLNTGEIVRNGVSQSEFGAVQYPDGWWRLYFGFASQVFAGWALFMTDYIGNADGGWATLANSPPPNSYIYAWGANVTDTTSLSSLILGAETAQVTRAADQLSYPLPAGTHDLRYTQDDGSLVDLVNASGTQTIPLDLPRHHAKSLKWKLKQ